MNEIISDNLRIMTAPISDTIFTPPRDVAVFNVVDLLRESIIDEFTKHWELNDAAHRIEHFLEVEGCGNYINDTLGLGYSPKLIMLVAFFHDLFAWSRYNHHLLSAEWVSSTDNPLFADLTEREVLLVAAGCREHRGSGTMPFTCEFAEMMCSADRGFPSTDLTGMLSRAVAFRTAQGVSEEIAIIDAKVHLKEKFGSNGYARYPRLYQKAFGDQLLKQQQAVDDLV